VWTGIKFDFNLRREEDQGEDTLMA